MIIEKSKNKMGGDYCLLNWETIERSPVLRKVWRTRLSYSCQQAGKWQHLSKETLIGEKRFKTR